LARLALRNGLLRDRRDSRVGRHPPRGRPVIVSAHPSNDIMLICQGSAWWFKGRSHQIYASPRERLRPVSLLPSTTPGARRP